MTWRLIIGFLAILAPAWAWAEGTAAVQPQRCRQAISAAERAHGIPAHLLAAIARVESGRRDAASGTFNPWPWTINVDGAGSFYDTKTQAVAAALSMRPHVAKSIDVGCMQISLTYHPDAFASMEVAFDPSSNADYGARFLVSLYGKTGTWPKAVAMYHSATEELGAEYQRQVYAVLPEEQKVAEVVAPSAPAAGALAGAWAATVNRSLLTSGLRPSLGRVIPLVTGAGGVVAPGRGLAAYRLAPVRLASRGF